jgi:hypothetical protein
LIRSTVDRWTKSTGAGPRATSALRELCVNPDTHRSPRGATAASPPAAQAILQISPPVSGIYKNSLPPYKRALSFSGLDPRFSNLSNPRSRAHPFASKTSSFHIKLCLAPGILLKTPLEVYPIHNLVPEPCFSHIFSILAPFLAFLVST